MVLHLGHSDMLGGPAAAAATAANYLDIPDSGPDLLNQNVHFKDSLGDSCAHYSFKLAVC